VWSSILNKPNA